MALNTETLPEYIIENTNTQVILVNTYMSSEFETCHKDMNSIEPMHTDND